MKTISEHLVDLELLPQNANVLDLGCRNFIFTNAMQEMGHNVVSVDIDILDGDYYKCAITDFDGIGGLTKTNDPQGTTLDKAGIGVPCYTLETFSKKVNVPFWDLIKIDVEGSEYEIITSLTKAPATQLSIEFHLHTGVYGKEEVEFMVSILLGLGYRIASHELSSQHGAGENFWSSLFVL